MIELGTGDAMFAPERRYPVGAGPGQLVVGDFNVRCLGEPPQEVTPSLEIRAWKQRAERLGADY